MRSARCIANLAVVAVGTIFLGLYYYPPGQSRFYPACPLYRYAHLYCPGCGATRALSALVRGNLSQAVHYNLLLVALLPVLALAAARAYRSAVVKDRIELPQIRVSSAWALLFTVVVFTVFRNIN